MHGKLAAAEPGCTKVEVMVRAGRSQQGKHSYASCLQGTSCSLQCVLSLGGICLRVCGCKACCALAGPRRSRLRRTKTPQRLTAADEVLCDGWAARIRVFCCSVF